MEFDRQGIGHWQLSPVDSSVVQLLLSSANRKCLHVLEPNIQAIQISSHCLAVHLEFHSRQRLITIPVVFPFSCVHLISIYIVWGKGEEVFLFCAARLLCFLLVLPSVDFQSDLVPFQDFRGCKCDEFTAGMRWNRGNGSFKVLHSLIFMVQTSRLWQQMKRTQCTNGNLVAEAKSIQLPFHSFTFCSSWKSMRNSQLVSNCHKTARKFRKFISIASSTSSSNDCQWNPFTRLLPQLKVLRHKKHLKAAMELANSNCFKLMDVEIIGTSLSQAMNRKQLREFHVHLPCQ
jgi:hypothetical protein